jgi:CDGSH-type Zn-finger protein
VVLILLNRDHALKSNVKVSKQEKIVLCRCWKSQKFPYCDGSHREYNEKSNDNLGPVIVEIEIN